MPSVCYSKSPPKTLIPVVGGFADTAAGRAQCFICSLNMTMKTEQKKMNSCLIQAKCWTSFSPQGDVNNMLTSEQWFSVSRVQNGSIGQVNAQDLP